MNWKDVVRYDPESPTGLRWIVDTQNSTSGEVAGSLQPDGYSRVQYADVREGCHIVVWQLHGLNVGDSEELDHKDGVRSRNVFENLRLVNTGLNARNRKLAANNTSGVTGVSLSSCKYPAWVAHWKPEGKKQCGKRFSVRKHGYEAAFHLACEYRADMIEELNLQGAGYTERHGT